MSDGKIELSARLRMIASFVPEGAVVADIGTDHGFLPIRLLQDGAAARALALDVREGPLAAAREHILLAGLSDQIETRLSDGFAALHPGEADTAVIAGMGGALIVRILTEGEETARSMRHLILSPQSEIDEVRRYLDGAGYEIAREKMLTDMGKYYLVMDVVPGKASAPLDETEIRFGRELIRGKDPVFLEYLDREENLCGTILDALRAAGTDRASARVGEIRGYLALIEDARRRMC
ncbi:tRNA (adenine(22)-N(1))-methyltransferase [Clostridium vitabionis]|jgi:tRNA (adenine22-N1)-methyltransferase|uniref:tRNA (adenine(22)-N(1))-methyltransferase n=1 Tax=Clostridium vitabionis TaxID=2784388 RepID=UPI001A9BF316|nr:class I SAM-dependent methyltransferase [Clostridium vitabionis]